MASKAPIYGKDLPANLGTDGVLRAIYDKISDGSSSEIIEEKLDIIFDELVNVNNSIETNTQAIKDISINVDIHTKDILSITAAINQQTEAIKNIQVHIDTSDLNNSIEKLAYNVEDGFNKTSDAIEDGFNKTSDAIKSLQPKPQPRPIPPCPPPHPYYPEPEPDIIFYPVTLGLPAPRCYFKSKDLCNTGSHIKCKSKEKKCECKIFVPEELRPNNYKNFDPFHTPYNPYCPPFDSKKPDYKPKVTYPKHV